MKRGSQSGGFNFEKIGGKVDVRAGGDVVGHDKITTTTSTKTISHGFNDQGDKESFQKSLDELRSALRGLKAEFESAPHLDQDAKDEIAASILAHLKELTEAKTATAEIPIGKAAAKPEQVDVVQQSLEKTSNLLDRLQGFAEGAMKFGDKAVDFSTKVGPAIAKIAPIIASARQFLGLP